MTFSNKVFKTALTSSYIKAEVLLTPSFLANLLMAGFVISWMLFLRIFLCLLASPLPKPFSTFSFTRHRYFCLIIPVVRKERRGGKQESNVYVTMNYAPKFPPEGQTPVYFYAVRQPVSLYSSCRPGLLAHSCSLTVLHRNVPDHFPAQTRSQHERPHLPH